MEASEVVSRSLPRRPPAAPERPRTREVRAGRDSAPRARHFEIAAEAFLVDEGSDERQALLGRKLQLKAVLSFKGELPSDRIRGQLAAVNRVSQVLPEDREGLV